MRRSIPLKRLVEPGRPITYGIVQAGEDVVDGVRYIRPVDMDGHRGVNPSSLRTTSPEIAAAYARSALKPGDVVVSIGPSFGKTMVVPAELDGANLTQGTARVAVRLDVEAQYIVWALQAQTSVDFWETSIGGATFRALNIGPLAGTPIPMPERDEQRAIADYLDRETARIDALIEEQQRLIGMLRERRAAVLSTALAPRDSWLRRRIKYIGHTQLGKMLDGGRAARMGDELKSYVRAADVRADGSVNLVDLKQMPFSTAELEVFDLRAGDVLLIEGGATVGRPGFMFQSAPGVAFQKTVNRLRVGPTADARFVYWSMLRLYESNYYANHYGAVSFVHLTGEKLREIELDLPSIDEQRRIAAYLDEQTAKIDALIAETERFVELSRERRSALITAAVTGQIDVSDEVA